MRWIGGFAVLIASSAFGQTPAEIEHFKKHVRPILEKHCFQCHSHASGKSKGGLMLDSRGAILTGGDTGPAFDPKHPDKSLIAQAIRYDDEDLQMPPKGKIPQADIDVLTKWLAAGAVWGGETKDIATKPGHVPGKISAEDRTWWAYQPVKRVEPPKSNSPAWDNHPIDRFVHARLEKEGLTPAPPASKAALIRRVTLDLTGLPPTPEEVEAFVRDEDPRAYETLVDRLLSSPRYGERQARRWLDLVRYAESDGFRLDGYRPSAWRYRDYVVRSFNADKPYDQFIREQLAGDEANPTDADAIIATGFLAAGIYEYNQRDVRTQHSDILNEMTDVTADVFLAQGLGCARCHDHKYDPILQKDYFRIRAFLEPVVLHQEAEVATAAQREAYEAKLEAWREKTKTLRDQIEAIEGPERKAVERSAVTKFPPDIQAIFKKSDRTPHEQQIYLLAYRQIAYEFDRLDQRIKGEKKDRLLELRRELAKFDSLKPPALPRTHLARDVGPTAPETYLPKKGSEPIAPGFLSVLDDSPVSITPTETSTGRRLVLANWIASPENPLTARVLVNRLWQDHFGKGLVATTSDFGRLGEPPSHPELLDWLAATFVQNNWSIRSMHRLMVTSQAYQQSALHPASDVAMKKDPENRFLWRGGTRRLDSEQIRDAILTVTGKLNLAAGGPSVEPREPRRSIFTKVQRNSADPLLEVFDRPEGFSSSAQRNTTTTTTQSLLLLNSPVMQQHARALADRVASEKLPNNDAVVERLFRLLFARSPSPAERKITVDFLERQPAAIGESPKVAAAGSPLEHAKLPFREGQAVALSPSSGPVRMMADARKIPEGDFTFEAFVLLRSTFEDGTVRTLASLWNGDSKSDGGWSFGVTSKKSAYKPQMLVLQLWGQTADGKKHYEPVFSSLPIALNKPYYVAVSAKLSDTSETGITFYAKDLTNDDEPMQVYQTTHKVAKMHPAAGKFSLGGADAAVERSWDGLIDDARLSRGVLTSDHLLVNSEVLRDDTVGYWQFEKSPGALRDTSPNGLDLSRRTSATARADNPRSTALVDLCLALLNSNEFLYVD